MSDRSAFCPFNRVPSGPRVPSGQRHAESISRARGVAHAVKRMRHPQHVLLSFEERISAMHAAEGGILPDTVCRAGHHMHTRSDSGRHDDSGPGVRMGIAFAVDGRTLPRQPDSGGVEFRIATTIHPRPRYRILHQEVGLFPSETSGRCHAHIRTFWMPDTHLEEDDFIASSSRQSDAETVFDDDGFAGR